MGTGAPFQQGIRKFFNLDIGWSSDIRFRKFENRHPRDATHFFLKFIDYIYRDNGYYVEWTGSEDDIQAFCSIEFFPFPELVPDLMASCLEYGLFDRDKYQKYQIITSMRIQKHYAAISKRRKGVILMKEYLTLNPHYFQDVYQNPFYLRGLDGEEQIMYTGAQEAEKQKEIEKAERRKKAKSQSGNTQPEPGETRDGDSEKKQDSPDNDNIVSVSHTEIRNGDFKVKFTKYNDVIDEISIPYNERDPAFKQRVSENWYNDFVWLNDIIDKVYYDFRACRDQLTLDQFIELKKDFHNPSRELLRITLDKLSANGNKTYHHVYSRIRAYLPYAIEDKNPDNIPPKPQLNTTPTPIVLTPEQIAREKKEQEEGQAHLNKMRSMSDEERALYWHNRGEKIKEEKLRGKPREPEIEPS